ncbi:hypothetical protein NESM_000348600 [Novymonas esmeraldas]|uniref:Uncharacterized protein n=1 Tax=Novymonas esmeraldas TaxID=1808958 RepID=A0AAW0EL18_9TRYP
MRSRRQTNSDTVSVFGMDPWKDDRVRDFVAINTIQRLRAYHLDAGAPMPSVEEINADRAMNLLLLPRAEPDYRPCFGEQPPSPAQRAGRGHLRRRHRAGRATVSEDSADESRSTSASSGTSTTASSSRGVDDVEGDQEPDSSGVSAGAGPRDSARQRRGDTRTLVRGTGRQLFPATSGGTAAAPTQCAVDRARAVFFGTLSFTSSTSPRRLVPSPHVPLTPSTASPATIAGRSATHVPDTPPSALPGATADPRASDAAEAPEAPAAPAEAVASATARSLGVELDAYVEANSTPLRPPPPLQRVGAPADTHADVTAQESARTLTTASVTIESGQGPIAASSFVATPAAAPPSGAPSSSSPAPPPPASAREAVARPRRRGSEGSADGSGSGDEDDVVHTCAVCDAIVQYYQSLLTRGVVLDRYNHKDLSFVWWVLGRNMDVSALEQRGPVRREALMITLRNFYYTLLSAEEAKATAAQPAAAAAAMKRAAEGRVAGGGAVRPAVDDEGEHIVEEAEEEERQRRVATQGRGDAGATPTMPARRRGTAVAVGRGHGGASGPAARGRPHKTVAASSASSSPPAEREAEEEERDSSWPDRAGDVPQTSWPGSTAVTRAPGAARSSRRTAAEAPQGTAAVVAELGGAAGSGLAAALRGEVVGEDSVASAGSVGGGGDDVESASRDGPDEPDARVGSSAVSASSSAAVSRAGSVAQSSTDGRRRHRRAAERNRAVEETWTSTRTGRRAAAIKAAAQLEMQGIADAAGHRVASEAALSLPTPSAPAAPTTASVTRERPSGGAEEDEEERERRSAPAPRQSAAAPATPTVSVDADPPAPTAAARHREEVAAVAKRPRTAGSAAPSHRGGSDSEGEDAMEDTRGGGGSGGKSSPAAPRLSTARASVSHGSGRAAAPVAAGTQAEQAAAPAVTTSAAKEKSGKTEEHRGRPRGSFKVPRVDPAATATATAATRGAPAAAAASAARAGPRRRDAVAPAAAPSTIESRSDAVSGGGASAAVPRPSPSTPADSSGSSIFPLCEMQLRPSPHERLVRSRIQQRMGAPVPTPRGVGGGGGGGSHDAAAATVYSSYTFLLSSFRTATAAHGGRAEARAITAPVVWYGPAVASAPSSPGECAAAKHVTTTTTATSPGEDGRPESDVASLATAIAAASALPSGAARQRGRKRKIEGGVDPCLRGCIFRHDHAALERRVRQRLAQEAAAPCSTTTATSGSGSRVRTATAEADVKKQEEEEEDGHYSSSSGGGGASAAVRTDRGTAAAAAASPPPASATAAAPPHAQRPVTGASAATTEAVEALTRLCRDDDVALLPSPPPAFSGLPYAHQCLLVWSAAGVLERHAHQQLVAEARRERLLAKCGRMATRRMAARVAAATSGGGGGLSDGRSAGGAEEAAARLASELGGGEDSDDASSGEESDSARRGGGRGTAHRHTRRHSTATAAVTRSSSSASSSTSTRSSSLTSSTSSEERERRAMRPLPRRVYDYWATFGSLSGST